MKHILITTIAAVVLLGCKSTSIHQAVFDGNIEAVKQHLAAGAEVNAIKRDAIDRNLTALDIAEQEGNKDTADLLRKHGGKTGEELKAEGK